MVVTAIIDWNCAGEWVNGAVVEELRIKPAVGPDIQRRHISSTSIKRPTGLLTQDHPAGTGPKPQFKGEGRLWRANGWKRIQILRKLDISVAAGKGKPASNQPGAGSDRADQGPVVHPALVHGVSFRPPPGDKAADPSGTAIRRNYQMSNGTGNGTKLIGHHYGVVPRI